MSCRMAGVATAWSAEAPSRSSLWHQWLARRRCRRCRCGFPVIEGGGPFIVSVDGSSGLADGCERDGFGEWAEWSDELRGEDSEVMRTRSLLFDPEGSLRQPRIGPDRLGRREHRTVG